MRPATTANRGGPAGTTAAWPRTRQAWQQRAGGERGPLPPPPAAAGPPPAPPAQASRRAALASTTLSFVLLAAAAAGRPAAASMMSVRTPQSAQSAARAPPPGPPPSLLDDLSAARAARRPPPPPPPPSSTSSVAAAVKALQAATSDAEAAAARGDWQAAEAAYARAIAAGPSLAIADLARISRALVLRQLGDAPGARLALEDVEASLRGRAEVHAALAALRYEARLPGAEEQWALASEFDRRFADVEWVAASRKWPPAMVDALRRFLELR